MDARAQHLGQRVIRSFEALRLKPYRDGGGVLTIGWGHKILPGETFGDGITRTLAEEILAQDFRIAATTAERLVTVDLGTPERWAALYSFVFNLGGKSFASSTLRRVINGRDLDAAPAQFLRWIYDNGEKVRGLLRRRAAEAALWTHDLPRFDALLAADPRVCEPLYHEHGLSRRKTA